MFGRAAALAARLRGAAKMRAARRRYPISPSVTRRRGAKRPPRRRPGVRLPASTFGLAPVDVQFERCNLCMVLLQCIIIICAAQAASERLERAALPRATALLSELGVEPKRLILAFSATASPADARGLAPPHAHAGPLAIGPAHRNSKELKTPPCSQFTATPDYSGEPPPPRLSA
eukprot:scaffold6814_cov117-Isochrysis_galbana.AAC.3